MAIGNWELICLFSVCDAIALQSDFLQTECSSKLLTGAFLPDRVKFK
jgi:hypothetical protein